MAGGGFQAAADRLVFRHIRSGRWGDLHQGDAPARLGIVSIRRSNAWKRASKPLDSPADRRDHQIPAAQTVEQPRCLPELPARDAWRALDRHRCRSGRPRPSGFGRRRPAFRHPDPLRRLAHHIVAKGFEIGLGVEADDVIGAERLHQIVVLGRMRRISVVGTACAGKSRSLVDAQFAQPFAQRNEVIIMHPDQIARAEQGRQLAGKGVVHAEIALHFRRLNSTRLGR